MLGHGNSWMPTSLAISKSGSKLKSTPMQTYSVACGHTSLEEHKAWFGTTALFKGEKIMSQKRLKTWKKWLCDSPAPCRSRLQPMYQRQRRTTPTDQEDSLWNPSNNNPLLFILSSFQFENWNSDVLSVLIHLVVFSLSLRLLFRIFQLRAGFKEPILSWNLFADIGNELTPSTITKYINSRSFERVKIYK